MKPAAKWMRLVVPAALLLALAACARRDDVAEGDDAAGGAVVPVRAAALAEHVFAVTVAAPGQWRASGEVVVAAPFGAYVESLRVEAGDAVERGAVLGVLVTRESRAAVLGAEQLVAAAGDPAARAQAARALAEAKRDVVRVPLRAPCAGTIVRRSASPGAEAAEGAELLAIVAPGALVFEAHVAPRDASLLRAGQDARVTMEDGAIVTAKVARILPQTAADQSAVAWLAPATPPPAAWSARFGTAAIASGAPRHATAVPDSAIVTDDVTGATAVAKLVGDSIAVWVPVRLGLAADGRHELLAPALPAGTRVAVTGQRGMPDSSRVSVAP